MSQKFRREAGRWLSWTLKATADFSYPPKGVYQAFLKVSPPSSFPALTFSPCRVQTPRAIPYFSHNWGLLFPRHLLDLLKALSILFPHNSTGCREQSSVSTT